MATVQGKHGMVILPDNFDSTGIRFNPTVPVDFRADNYDYNADMTTNIYDAEEWKKMEDAGAVFFPCAGLAVNIPDSISKESCYTKSIFGVVAQIPEIYKDSKEEEWLYLDSGLVQTRRHFYRQIKTEHPSNIGYNNMHIGMYLASDKRRCDPISFPIIYFSENIEGSKIASLTRRYIGDDLYPVRLVKDAE
jgi:hypothetical protein